MKYIRTKDNLIGERIFVNDIPEPQNDKERELLKKLRENICQTIIKQADTIEELCDEFVVYTPNMYSNMKVYLRYEFESKLDRAIQDYKNYQDINEEVYLYGAIWTDKGLIYVAKMNDKGELELL